MVKKVDFHIHTVPSIKDSEFAYSSEWLIKYVNEASLDAIAITNHDLFDKDNYDRVKEDLLKARDGNPVVVFPGMELALEKFHVNIVFPESMVDELTDFSSWLQEKHVNQNSSITIDELFTNLKNWNQGIYIFELGKSKGIDEIPTELHGVTAVGGVRNQFQFQIIKNQEDSLTPVLFSDAHATEIDSDPDRNDIDKLKSKSTYIQIDNCSFLEIKNCITDKSKVSLTRDNLQDVVEIDGHNLSTGLNLVVGKRGTGKTHFLEQIKKQFDKEEIYEIAQFETAKADSYIEKQRKEQGNKAFENWKEKYNRHFLSISNYLDSIEENYDEKIERYIESVKEYASDLDRKGKSQQFNLFKEAPFELQTTEYIEDGLNSLLKLIKNERIWSLFENSQSKRSFFIDTYNELREKLIEKNKAKSIRENVNLILRDSKEFLTSQTGIRNVQDVEISKVIKKKQIEKSISSFLEKVITTTELKREKIHGYQIIVNLLPFQNASQFRADFATQESVQEDLIKPYLSKNYITFLKNLKNKKFYNSANLAEYFMHKEVKLLDSDGTPASGGQAVGFALMLRLNEARQKNVILIDEPESSLDNAYIQTELNSALKELAKHRMVFVVTHNSTLGTLLEPDYLVVTTKNEQNEYTVLTGEFSSNKISDSKLNSESSFEKFVEAMEAGIDTYHKKGEIYGNLNH